MKTVLILFHLLIGFALAETATHEKMILDEGVYTEGTTFGDVNGDGQPDLIAGPHWWEGPKFETSHRYRAGKSFTRRGYGHSSFQSWVMDMNGDGLADIFQVSHDGVFHLDLYLQPETPSAEWPMHRVAAKIGNESPEFVDITGDGRFELLAMRDGKFGIFIPNWSDATKAWSFHPISARRTKSPYFHGLGYGDINGDTHIDILVKDGWYEAPADPFSSTNWTFHPHKFGTKRGGAQMLVYDIDGDGDADIVTSLDSHSWGLAWFEQIKADGKISFKRHTLIPENKNPGVGGVSFTQAHALALGDFNGDGLTDFATGKRHWAHNGRDPDA